MNLLDLLICALLAGLLVLGVVKGMLRLVLGGGSLLLAWWVATGLYRPLAEGFLSDLGPGPAAEVTAFILLFVFVVLAMVLASRLLIGLLRAAHLRWMDRAAGGVLGLAIAIALTAALLVPITAILPPEHPLLRDSRLLPWVEGITVLIVPLVPDDVRRSYDNHRPAYV